MVVLLGEDLPHTQHLETHPDSLLSKIFGLHRVTRRRGLPKVYFAIFNNVFDSPDSLNEIFDLKVRLFATMVTDVTRVPLLAEGQA